MVDYKEKIESLKNQQEQAKELFLKLQGAIEILNSLSDEEKKDKEKDSSKKEDKK